MDNLDNLIWNGPTMSITEPVYICPVHGEIKGFVHSLSVLGTNFCIHCIKDKMIEIGVCEVVRKDVK